MALSVRVLIPSIASVVLISGCANKPLCEDILEVKRQNQVCNELSKVMQDSNHPQQALTARKRFEEECENLRYYRDDYDTICKGHDQPIGTPAIKEEKEN